MRVTGTGLEAVAAMIAANLTAQLVKFLRDWRKHRRPNLTLLVATGGMPSSHSATVAALTTSVGLVAGWEAPVFAVAFCFAGIVMYDAAGLRRAASEQARVLNEIVEELLAPQHHLNVNKLKEFLGHTPREVLAGALLGVGLSVGLHWLLRLF